MTTEKPVKFTLNGKNYVHDSEGVKISCNDCAFQGDDQGCRAAPTTCIAGGVYKESKE